MKKCSKCKELKELSEFHKQSRANDGLKSACKSCRNKINFFYRLNNKKKISERMKIYNKENSEEIAAKIKSYQQSVGGKLVMKRSHAKYRKTQRGIETERLYRMSDKNKEIQNKYRISNIYKIKEYQLKYRNTDKGKKIFRISSRRYRKLNPEKIKAHHAVNNAIASGKLIKPKTCYNCHIECNTEGHHHLYDKMYWLDVVWLCRQCHVNIHKLEKNN